EVIERRSFACVLTLAHLGQQRGARTFGLTHLPTEGATHLSLATGHRIPTGFHDELPTPGPRSRIPGVIRFTDSANGRFAKPRNLGFILVSAVQRRPSEGVLAGGPGRDRTCDQRIMSPPL